MSPSPDICNMFGGFCKAYRSLISKRYSDHDNPSANKPKPHAHDDQFKPKPKPKSKSKSNSIHETNKNDDKNHEGTSMSGGDGNEPASPKGSFKNRFGVDNCFTSRPSPLSRTRSTSSTSFSRNPPSLSKSPSRRRSRTPTPVAAARRVLRSVSRNNVDTSPSPSSSNGDSFSMSLSDRNNEGTGPSVLGGSLSKSLSRKGSSTIGFPEGGLLSRSTSSRKGSSSTAFSEAADTLSRSTSSRRSTTPIMYSSSSGLLKPPAIEKTLECTLEELCFGCTKQITITRDVVTINGQVVQEEEMLAIQVQPGWRKGTKVTFEGFGNEIPGTYPADINFVIAEKRHRLYRREDDDLELAVELPLVKALTGCTLSVPLLGGEKMSLEIDYIIQPDYEKIIAGQGMPKSKEQGNRGNLIVKFLVHFPTELTEEQRADVSSILRDCC